MKTIFTFEYKNREVEAVLYPNAGIVCFFYKDTKEVALFKFVLMDGWSVKTKAGVVLIKKSAWKAIHRHVKAMIELFEED